MQLTHLMRPLRIGGQETKNRILSTGHQTCLVDAAVPNDALIAYHEARARGGVGLIVTEIAAVHPTAFFSHLTIEGYKDACIPGYERLAQALHRHDVPVIGQLFHPGREVFGATADGRRAIAYGVSETPSERYLVPPVPMSTDLIGEIVEGYAATACRMQAAGLDGAEIVASHGYLPAQFLSPRINEREDAYGGDAVGRRRFLMEVIAAVRARVGEDFLLGLRISHDEMTVDGIDAEDCLGALRAVERDGRVSYYNITAGSSSSTAGAIHIVPTMRFEPGYIAGSAEEVKGFAERPVFVTGRINQPQVADRIIAAGSADMCGMTRAMICDPDMGKKAAEGRLDDIRACIGCNQACIGHMQKNAPISCIQFPESGRELRFALPIPAKRPKRVAVVGGGPAGMKAAAVAASRGHEVTLFEQDSQLGGQVLLAQLLPGRAEFGGLASNLTQELALAGVAVRTRVKATPGLLLDHGADSVILATGARPYAQPIEGEEEAHIVDAWQVLKKEVSLGHSVVVADSRADWVGVGLAEMLARDGHWVRYVTNNAMPGAMLQSFLRDQWLNALRRLEVSVTPNARLSGADAQTAYFQDTFSGEAIALDDVSSIVVAKGVRRVAALHDGLKDYPGSVHLVGDCLSPRSAEEAIFEGLEVASKI